MTTLHAPSAFAVSAQPLTALYIPDAVPIPRGYPDAALWGVGLAAINDGLRVFIEPWTTMATGDRADVFWSGDDAPVATVTVTADNLGSVWRSEIFVR